MKRGLLLLAAATVALLAGAASADRTTGSPGPRAELVVLLEGPPASATVARDQRAFLERLRRDVTGARVGWRYRVVLNGFSVDAPAGARAQIAALPGVERVYGSVRYHRSLFRSPAVIGAPVVWGPTLATAGEGVKIGILDDGVDRTHPFFSPAGFAMPAGFPKGNAAYTTAKVIVARSFAPPGATGVAQLPFDARESEHGTHVAGIAAGDHDTPAQGVRVSGIAPRAYLGNYRVLTIPTGQFGLDGNSPEIAAGIEQAVLDGMDVINLSLGEPEITPGRDVVVQAINGAARAGVIPVIAAGNDFDVMGPGSVDSPGAAARAITAAASTKNGVIASFSSGGPAPVSLGLKPDVSAPGAGILSSVPARAGTWRTFDGTSMAAPHVAGAAAVLHQRHPGWTVDQVKSALVLTGQPVRGSGGEVPPTREGGGRIWLPAADQPLVFARPTGLSFGLLRRGSSRALRVALGDAGGGAGSWQARARQLVRAPGTAVSVPATVAVPGTVGLRIAVSRRAGAHEGSGFIVLTRGGRTRRVPYWFRVTAARLARHPRTMLRRPGTYRGNTRGQPSLVSSYRYPAAPGSLGISQRLNGPEQVFRFVLRRRVANAGAIVLSQSPGSHVSPRLVQAGNEDRLAGFAALPLRLNPYQPAYYAIEPVVAVFRPSPGAYDLVFDTPSRRSAGRFTFRFWVNDTAPPSSRLLTSSVAQGAPLRLRVTDRGSGVDPSSLLAAVDGRLRSVVYVPALGEVRVELPRLASGPHRLIFAASDYQETKNTENAGSTLPNTGRLVATFRVR